MQLTMENEDFHRTSHPPDKLPVWDREAVWSQIERELDHRRRRRLLPFWWVGFLLFGLLSVLGWRIFHTSTTTPGAASPGAASPSAVSPGVASPEPSGYTVAGQTLEAMIPTPPTTQQNLRSVLQPAILSWSLSPVAGKKAGWDALPTTEASFRTMPHIGQLDTPILIQPEPNSHKIIPGSGISLSTIALLPGLSLYRPLLSTTPPVMALPRILILDKWRKDPILPPDGKAPRFWEIQVGLLYADRHIQPRSAAGDAYTEALRHSFDLRGAFQMTARCYQPLKRKITLHAGIQYLSTVHWFNFKTSTSEISTIASDSAAFYQFNGITHFLPGNRMQTVTTVRNYHSPGRLERLLLPVGIGWAPHASSGWFADAGMAIPIVSRYRGYMVDPQQELTGKSQGMLKNIYNPSGSLAAFGQLGYRVATHNHWRFSCTVFVQGDMGNLWKNTTNVRVRERLVGLKLGVIGW